MRAVIFDMDGVLIDTECLYSVFWNKALAYYGFQATDTVLSSLRSLSRNLAKELLTKTYGETLNYEQVRCKRVELMDEYLLQHGVTKKLGAVEILEYLKKSGYQIGLATSTDLTRTTRHLECTGLLEYFDQIVCGPMVANGKPAPDIYRMAADRLGVEPKDCYAIEDSANGVLAAYRAGCKVIAIPDQESLKEEICRMPVTVQENLITTLKWIEEQ